MRSYLLFKTKTNKNQKMFFFIGANRSNFFITKSRAEPQKQKSAIPLQLNA